MYHDNHILRFQDGRRSQHPTPEAVIVTAPPGAPSDIGEQLMILVDLTPPLPHRSREIRATLFNTYWNSSGSVVARLRRALAEANRHLVHVNMAAEPGAKCSGSVTAAVVVDKELFLGQVGPAYALVCFPDGLLQAFPQRNRILMPLGATLPPIINIAYTPLEYGSTLLLATTPVAESQARENWNEYLSAAEIDEGMQQILDVMAQTDASGSLILTRFTRDVRTPQPSAPVQRRRKPWQWWSRRPVLDHAIPVEVAQQADKSPVTESVIPGAEVSVSPLDSEMGEPGATASAGPRLPVAEPDPASPLPDFLRRRGQDAAQDDVDAVAEDTGGLPQLRLPPLREWLRNLSLRRRRGQYRERSTTAEHARLRQALRALLPGQVEGVGRESTRNVPQEKVTIMGVSLGVLVLVAIVTLSIYLQFGGAAQAEELLGRAQIVLSEAYASQNKQDWYNLRDICSKIQILDPQNVEAEELRLKAEQAIDALESAALLEAHLLLDLGVAPIPRRLLVADQWVYILNTATDEVLGLELASDGTTPLSTAATTVLKHGQTFYGESVSHLVDLTWIVPGGDYPDGAIFVYSDGGTVYIYEPALGPESITRQRVQGNLEPGMVTLMAALGDEFYLVQRQENQILHYAPINGIYDLPRGYFAPDSAPYLQEALDVGMDGRMYLLMGDGTVRTYFDGTEDHSFEISDLPDPNLTPVVMAVESDPDNGLVYLGDVQRGRIVILNKHGTFQHQFRLPGEELKQLEAIAVSESPRVLYLITANRLYAASLPDFVTQQ